jgi:hypothetical protein
LSLTLALLLTLPLSLTLALLLTLSLSLTLALLLTLSLSLALALLLTLLLALTWLLTLLLALALTWSLTLLLALPLTLLLTLLALRFLHSALKRIQFTLCVRGGIQCRLQLTLRRVVHCRCSLSELFRRITEIVRGFLFSNRGTGGIGLDIVSSRLHPVCHTIGLKRIRCSSCRRSRLGILGISSGVLEILLSRSRFILQIPFTLTERLKSLLSLRRIRGLSLLPCFIEKLLLLVLQVLQLLCLLTEVPVRIVRTILVLSLTQGIGGIPDCICRLVRCLLLLLRRAVAHGLLHILDGLVQLSRSFRNLRVLRISRQLLQLTLQCLSFAKQIPLSRLVRGATATLSCLSGALTSCSFLAFGEVRELLCQFIDFLLGLLILLSTGSLAALHLLILVLAGVQFEGEKIR